MGEDCTCDRRVSRRLSACSYLVALAAAALCVVATSCSALYSGDQPRPDVPAAQSQATAGSEPSPVARWGVSGAEDLLSYLETYLEKAHDDRLYEISLSACEQLLYVFPDGRSPDQLMVVLQDDGMGSGDRVLAGRELGLMQHSDALEPLLDMLAQPRRAGQHLAAYYDPRNEVIRALGDLGDPRAVPALVGALADRGVLRGGGIMFLLYYESDLPPESPRVPWRRCTKVPSGFPGGAR